MNARLVITLMLCVVCTSCAAKKIPPQPVIAGRSVLLGNEHGARYLTNGQIAAILKMGPDPIYGKDPKTCRYCHQNK